MKTIYRTILLVLSLSCTMACAKNNGYDFTDSNEIPDNLAGTEIGEGMTLYGQVSDTEGRPVAGVAVSDGRTVAVTDANGVYQMKRNKLSRYVFYTTPSDYEISRDPDGYPLFYRQIDQTQSCARCDFILTPLEAPETRFALVCIADPQCKTASEVSRYVSETIPDVEKTVEKYKAQGINSYGMTLGDIIFDTPDLWTNMKTSMSGLNLPVFQTIGNHDHLQNVASESLAEANYEMYFGPRNYSFDRGNAHIISMDNVLYKGGAGGSNYDGGISDAQLEWLKADLALVDKSRCVIFCAHIPFRGLTNKTDESYRNGKEVLELLSGFAEAHLMIGHTHYCQNYVHNVNGKKIIEHIHGAACGAWWYSTFCTDGTPNGYAVYEFSGPSVSSYYYKATDKDEDFQMRAYPGAALFGESGVTKFGWGPNSSAYNDPKCIVVNVWNAIIPSFAGSAWSVELYQNGTKVCDMTNVSSTEWWAYGNFVVNYGRSTSATYSNTRNHIYKGMLRSGDAVNDPDGDLDFEVRVTDQNGNVYRCTSLQRTL